MRYFCSHIRSCSKRIAMAVHMVLRTVRVGDIDESRTLLILYIFSLSFWYVFCIHTDGHIRIGIALRHKTWPLKSCYVKRLLKTNNLQRHPIRTFGTTKRSTKSHKRQINNGPVSCRTLGLSRFDLWRPDPPLLPLHSVNERVKGSVLEAPPLELPQAPISLRYDTCLAEALIVSKSWLYYPIYK